MIWIVLGIMFLLFFGTGWIFHKVERLRDEKKRAYGIRCGNSQK